MSRQTPEDGTAEALEAEVAPQPVSVEARAVAVDALGYLPRALMGAFADLRSIALSVRVLPDVARHLGSIQVAVESMDSEVKEMRRAVEQVDTDVLGVVAAVAPLDEKLDDLRLTLHPLSRATALLGRRGERSRDSAPTRE